MSTVTDLCILVGHTPHETEIELEDLGFINVAKNGGGNKVCQGDIWVMSVNYLDSDKRWCLPDEYTGAQNNLLTIIKNLTWFLHDSTDYEQSIPKFFIQHEHDPNWHIWDEWDSRTCSHHFLDEKV